MKVETFPVSESPFDQDLIKKREESWKRLQRMRPGQAISISGFDEYTKVDNFRNLLQQRWRRGIRRAEKLITHSVKKHTDGTYTLWFALDQAEGKPDEGD